MMNHYITHRTISKIICIAVTAFFSAITLSQCMVAADLASPTLQPQIINQDSWTNVAIGGGGYVTGVYLHPQQEDLVYIKTDVGGFYRWNAVEQKWIPLTDHFPLSQSNYYGGEALALDPNNPSIVYIAAGKYLWADRGTIFKSTDQGATWKKLNLDLPMGGNQDKRWIGERLAINPFNSNEILFGSRQNGLWRSSDAGTTWSHIASFPGKPEADIGITAIAFDRNRSGLVYANAYGDGIYESTDAGITWSRIAGSPAKTMRIAIASNRTLYVTSATSPGVRKYTNNRWSNITPLRSWKDTIAGSQMVFNGLSINPTNASDILVSLGETTSTKIYRSLNGGTTWQEQKYSINNTVPWWRSFMLTHRWVSAVEFDPKVAGRVWLTDWYGIWKTDDINASRVTWTNYQKGHEELVTFALVSPPTGTFLLSGVADVDGFFHNNGLDAFPSKTFGNSGPTFQDTFSIAYSEQTPLRMVRVGGNRWSSTYGGATSTDGGLTWQQFTSFPTEVMPMRVAVSATNPNLFIVTTSGRQALRTDNGGHSWQPVSGLPNGVEGPWNWSQPLTADKVNGKTFYYYADGKVYRSNNGGLSFATVNSSLPHDGWHLLKTVPGVAGEVWLSLNWQGLYHSSDGGATFNKIAGVERAYLFAIGKPQAQGKVAPLYLYGKIKGLGEGIFQSLDRGITWLDISDMQQPIGNEPNVMEASHQQYGLVFIGTNGRGIYYKKMK
jgi:photosystem II stability/assembly factor-like uncharacterized protein